MIEIKNVNFRYKGSDEGSLEDLSLTIHDGETVLLCGSSGCGKTTVGRLINGLIPHYYKGELTGSVTVNGRDIAQTELYDLAGVVGTVFQNPRSQFFAIDTDGEITFGAENIGIPPEAIVSRKNDVAREMHIERLLDRSIFELSGGEKQIIACASVSVLSPDIMVLDEPSSNLDSSAIEKLKAILADWKSQGKTIIIAEHRLYFLRELADRMLLLDNGRIVKELQADEIRALTFADTERMGIRPLSLTDVTYTRERRSRPDETLTLENFFFTYKDGKHGINIPKLELPARSTIAIIGHNGAGKSTLARNICGLEKKCKGTLTLGGKTFKAKERLKICYMIMQDVNHQLFTESVRDEVMLSITDKQITDTEKTHRSGYLPVMVTKAKGESKGAVLLHGGNDSYYEELFFPMLYLAENGFDVYLYEGPGQGGVLRLQNMKFTHKWERPTKAVLSYFKLRDVTIIGASLGGYLAPRAAAFDKRIKRVVGWSIFPDFFDVVICDHPKPVRDTIDFMFRMGMDAPMNKLYTKMMEKEEIIKWNLLHGMYAYDAKTPADYVRKIRRFTLKGIADKIDQDVLIIGANKDHFIMPYLFHEEYDMLQNARSLTLRLLTDKQNAGAHCNVGNSKLVFDSIIKWIECCTD